MDVVITLSSLMIKLEMDEKSILPEFLTNAKKFANAVEKTMADMANETKTFWYTEAGRVLNSSRTEYQEAIQIMDIDSKSFTIGLAGGFLPYAIEVGVPAYPMKVGRGQIVPLNVNREVPFVNPRVYVTGTGEPWHHPGFAGKHVFDSVKKELNENIIPKHMTRLMNEASK